MKSKVQLIFTALVLGTALCFVVCSCNSNKEHLPPVINLTSPTNGYMFHLPDSLPIRGTVTDEENLHEMSIFIVKSTGDTVFEDAPYIHDLKSYTIRYDFFPSSAGDYTLHIVAENHDELKAEKTASFMVM